MPEKTLAAVKVGASTLEMRELDLPDIGDDDALLKVEVAGVCGTDVSQYRLPLRGSPLIMGHENVGYLAAGGKAPGADESYYHLRAIERILPADAHWLEVLKPEMYPAGAPI